MVFFGEDFITVKKTEQTLWDEIKPKSKRKACRRGKTGKAGAVCK